jgi:Ca2+-binding EF-hand superfamily protein
MKLRCEACALALLAALILSGSAAIAHAKENPAQCPALKAFDPDNDGTIDVNEAKDAATKLFDKLEKDNDGTLTAKELQGRLSKKELAAGDPDKDATLTKDEYLAIVEARFKNANSDADETIDCKEFKSAHGRALLRVLK